MQTVTLHAFAKINLTLDVTEKRDDGYHCVRMVMQSVSLYDTLTLTRRKDDAVVLSIEGAPGLETDEGNLVVRAIRKMKETYGIPSGVEAHLTKRIPMAAGLAGGSADAAAAFRGMNLLFGLSVSDAGLQHLSLPLGADIPFCLTGGTRLAEGIGEKLSALSPMPECHILLAKPPEAASTKDVYTSLDRFEEEGRFPKIVHPDVDGQMAALKRQDLFGVCRTMGNVLETVTLPLLPSVRRLRDLLRAEGALGAMMTGSGSTVFGIFSDEDRMRSAQSALESSGLCEVTEAVLPVPQGVVCLR